MKGMGKMNIKLKRVLRFYFSAGSLNVALNNIITRLAATSWQDVFGGEHTFDKVNTVIEVKEELKEFWARLNGVMEKFPRSDYEALKKYASLRVGVSPSDNDERRKMHSALVKFRRRAINVLLSSQRGYRCVCAYYALISSAPD
ncbi:MAG: hypothetical protein ACI4QI_05325 [Candidatus Coproplasma sp.]